MNNENVDAAHDAAARAVQHAFLRYIDRRYAGRYANHHDVDAVTLNRIALVPRLDVSAWCTVTLQVFVSDAAPATNDSAPDPAAESRAVAPSTTTSTATPTTLLPPLSQRPFAFPATELVKAFVARVHELFEEYEVDVFESPEYLEFKHPSLQCAVSLFHIGRIVHQVQRFFKAEQRLWRRVYGKASREMPEHVACNLARLEALVTLSKHCYSLISKEPAYTETLYEAKTDIVARAVFIALESEMHNEDTAGADGPPNVLLYDSDVFEAVCEKNSPFDVEVEWDEVVQHVNDMWRERKQKRTDKTLKRKRTVNNAPSFPCDNDDDNNKTLESNLREMVKNEGNVPRRLIAYMSDETSLCVQAYVQHACCVKHDRMYREMLEME